MTNEVFNVSTNVIGVNRASVPSSSDWWFLIFCIAFAGLIFLLMYLGRPKDDPDKSNYEGEEY